MSFTSEEIRSAVDAFLNSPVEVPSLSTGARDILLARDRAFDLIVNALVGDPRAVYHLIWLASNKFYGLISDQVEALSEIQRAAYESQQVKFRPYSRFDELITARTALLELDAAVVGSGVGASGPGVGRFQRVTRQFVNRELRPALPTISNLGVTTIPDTPVNLRRTVQRTWSTVRKLDKEIKALSSRMSSVLEEFEKLRLPERSIQSLIGKLRSRMNEIYDDLSSDKAETASRQAYLDLLIMDSILGRTTSFLSPTLVLGQGDDAVLTGSSSGAVASSILSGPYALNGGESLEIVIDGVSEIILIPALNPIKGKLRAQDVADAINTHSSATATVRLSSFTTTAYIFSNAGSEDKLYLASHSSDIGETTNVENTLKVADWVTDSDFVLAAYVILEEETYPGGGGVYTIMSANLGTHTLTLSPPLPFTSTGVSYALTPPSVNGVAPGDKVDIHDTVNIAAGNAYYEVAAVDSKITLDTNIILYRKPSLVAGSLGAEVRYFSAAEVEFFTEYLDVAGPPGSTFDIPFSTTSFILGLESGNLQSPIGAGFSDQVNVSSNIVFYGGIKGDILELDGVAHTVKSVVSTVGGAAVTLDQELPSTTVPMGYRYLSSQHLALQALLSSAADYPDDIVTRFDVPVAQVLRGNSAALLSTEFVQLKDTLDAIKVSVQGYTSFGRSRGLDAAVVMMREQGMDRAVDLLLSLRLFELFTMNRDGVSYNTNLARAAATATRVVSPVSRDQTLTEDVVGVFRSDSGMSR